MSSPHLNGHPSTTDPIAGKPETRGRSMGLVPCPVPRVPGDTGTPLGPPFTSPPSSPRSPPAAPGWGPCCPPSLPRRQKQLSPLAGRGNAGAGGPLPLPGGFPRRRRTAAGQREGQGQGQEHMLGQRWMQGQMRGQR